MTGRKRLTLLGLLLLLTLGAAFWARRQAQAPPPALPQTEMPRGRWRLAPPPTGSANTANATPEDLARTISLPYLAGSQAAPGAPVGSGVTVWDRKRAFPGINLYTSGHAPEVILMDMSGRTGHRWRYPFERAFPGKAPTDETPFFRRAQLGADGTLYAIYQGGGLIALDPSSRLLWKVDAGTYNDFFLAPDGAVYLLAKEAKRIPEISATGLVLEDSILVVGRDGKVRDRISLLRALLDSPYAKLFSPRLPAGDVLHSNTIEVFDGRLASRSPLFAAGNALVSFRQIDTIGIVDLKARRFVWAQRGPWAGQHQPTLLDNGRILLFDNQPHERSSRALEFDPLSGTIEWQYPPPAAPSDAKGIPLLASEQAGACQRLPNGDTLITESDHGQAF